MSTEDRAYPTKVEWGAGPWQDEPDELAWSFGDVACRIVRHPSFGSLNGYVAVPPGHPWHGLEDLDADVHGGITYSGPFDEHTYASATDGQWWVGFDAGHYTDLSPGLTALVRHAGGLPEGGVIHPFGIYRDLAYVRSETERLARQATEASRR